MKSNRSSNIFANDIRFDEIDGSYKSFDPEEFTSRAGGKAEAVKHIKKTEEQPGGIFLVEGKIHYSNVALLDPETGRPCRTSYRYLEDGTKVRVAQGRQASVSIIPFPAYERKKPRNTVVGPKCTPEEEVNRVTYTAMGRREYSTTARRFTGFAASTL